MSDLVRVTDLSVVARADSGEQLTIVDDIGFSIPKGEVLALIGESGSGKTTIALALLRYVRAGCSIASGSVQIGDANIMSIGRSDLARIRGNEITYIAQSAAAAFNPSKTILDQVVEPVVIHRLANEADAEKKAVELFRSLALPHPEFFGRRFPHQVSGGQLQRVMAAMALITSPKLVIFDEPTTALDVTTQIEVLRTFKQVIKEFQTTAVYVSHDLAVVAQMADQIVVLRQGRICEIGQTEQVLDSPSHEYTKELVAAANPVEHATTTVVRPSKPLLAVQALVAGYGKTDREGLPANPVLDDIEFTMQRGATLGVIGESGSGKSTLARVLAGLLAPARGTVELDGEHLPSVIAERTRDQLRRIQIVFQNADTALNPAHTVGYILDRPLRFYHKLGSRAREKRIAQLLDLVQLPVDTAKRRCGELSGGQKQRINLARALAADPDLILCDEVTSALDTVVGAAILDLLAELRHELKVSYLFISHDISTVRAICDEVLVLYAGQKVEHGTRETCLSPPFHPYTALLVSSVPELECGWLEKAGMLPPPPAIGANDGKDLCRFLQRCPKRINGVCNTTPPPRLTLRSGNEILCHRRDL